MEADEGNEFVELLYGWIGTLKWVEIERLLADLQIEFPEPETRSLGCCSDHLCGFLVSKTIYRRSQKVGTSLSSCP